MQFSFRYQRKHAVPLRGGAVAPNHWLWQRAVVRDQRIFAPLTEDNIPAGTCASQLCFSLVREAATKTLLVEEYNQGESTMIIKEFVLVSCAAIVLSVATAQAGPCNTGGKSADAGAGPTPGNTGQTVGTTGSANAEHPPTSAMNRATGDAAASSQDAQKQMQGQPTAAQQGQGAQPSAKMADQGC
jgi:hypothetical protein